MFGVTTTAGRASIEIGPKFFPHLSTWPVVAPALYDICVSLQGQIHDLIASPH